MVYRRPLRCADIPIEEHVFASERPWVTSYRAKSRFPQFPQLKQRLSFFLNGEMLPR